MWNQHGLWYPFKITKSAKKEVNFLLVCKELGRFLVVPFEFSKTPQDYFDELLPNKPQSNNNKGKVDEVKLDICKEKVKRFSAIKD